MAEFLKISAIRHNTQGRLRAKITRSLAGLPLPFPAMRYRLTLLPKSGITPQ